MSDKPNFIPRGPYLAIRGTPLDYISIENGAIELTMSEAENFLNTCLKNKKTVFAGTQIKDALFTADISNHDCVEKHFSQFYKLYGESNKFLKQDCNECIVLKFLLDPDRDRGFIMIK